MAQTIKIIIDDDTSGERLDAAISAVLTDFSRSRIHKLISGGAVLLNGAVAKPSKTVKAGDEVLLTSPDLTAIEVLPEDIPLDIVYQNSAVVVINKQQGLTVHPAGGIYTNTLVNALLYHIKDLSGINGVLRPGIVHRLDKDTSGLMLVAKNDVAHRDLAEQIATKSCKRIYYALVEGVMKQDSGTVDEPIGRSRNDRKKMAIDQSGKNAVTNYTVLQRYEKNTLVKFQLQTGRTHQIRIHTKFLGYPIVGDKAYGFKNQRFKLDGQLLHSKEIEFKDPDSGERLHFETELPSYFQKVLKILENEKI